MILSTLAFAAIMSLFLRRYRLLAGGVLLMMAPWVQAASLSVNPVMITLDGSNAISAMTITNRGDDNVVMQASINAWSIQDNQERYQSTTALVVSPPVFELAAGASQIIRVGLSDTTPSTREQSFRVFLEQAPATPGDSPPVEKDFMAALAIGPASQHSSGTSQTPRAIQMMLRIGIPVFVTPSVVPARELSWSASRLNDGRLRVEASNQGNAHVRISRLSLMQSTAEAKEGAQPVVMSDALRYVLPGSRRYWLFTIPAHAVVPYHLKAETNEGVLDTTITTLTP